MQASLGRLEAALGGVISDARADAKGRRGAAQNASRRAHHLMSVYFGLRVLAKAGAAPEVLEGAKLAALEALADT